MKLKLKFKSASTEAQLYILSHIITTFSILLEDAQNNTPSLDPVSVLKSLKDQFGISDEDLESLSVQLNDKAFGQFEAILKVAQKNQR